MKISDLSRLAGIALGMAILAPTAQAYAATVLETAAFTGADPGDFITQGDGTDEGSAFLGARFSLSQQTEITSVGVGLGEFGAGTIFAAIVALSGADAVPSVDPASLASIALGSVVFDVPAGVNDVTADLPLTLGAGEYAVVFGSGLFGASGFGPVDDGNETLGNHSMFESVHGADWDEVSPDGIRIVVHGAPVPEPATLSLLAVGGALIGAVRWRARRAA